MQGVGSFGSWGENGLFVQEPWPRLISGLALGSVKDELPARGIFLGFVPEKEGADRRPGCCAGGCCLCILSPRKETPKFHVVQGKGCSKPTHRG